MQVFLVPFHNKIEETSADSDVRVEEEVVGTISD